MNARAAELISSLGLAAHPEGGFFREVHRSGHRVQPLDGRPSRPALTTIDFLLVEGDVSRWHRVASDEVWTYYEGDAVELFTANASFEFTRHVLGASGAGVQPVHVVPANAWQAARSTGAYTLVGCTVGPGFEYADFEMLRDRAGDADALRKRRPELAAFI
jgi:predicted cupin superfamily sugar epimerase